MKHILLAYLIGIPFTFGFMLTMVIVKPPKDDKDKLTPREIAFLSVLWPFTLVVAAGAVLVCIIFG